MKIEKEIIRNLNTFGSAGPEIRARGKNSINIEINFSIPVPI